MNNTIWRFTINPKKSLFVSDELAFIDDLTLSKEIWYEYPHYYSDDTITWYRAAIIQVDLWTVDVGYIKWIYWIEPNKIYWHQWYQHLVFLFKKSLTRLDYNRISWALSFLYDWTAIDYHFYPKNWVTIDYSTDIINDNLMDICTQVYFFKDQKSDYQKYFTITEYDKYLECDKLKISKVIEELYSKDTLKLEAIMLWVDEKHNIHKNYWYSFELVNKYYGSPEKAKLFFNDKFSINFDDTNPLDFAKVKDWIVIKEWEWLFINNSWYFTLDAYSNHKKITDFYIKVHSKIISNDWKHNFVVTMVNEIEWVETKKIIWENKTSTWAFSDFIQSYWPFHYYGTAPFIKELHRQISTCKQVPEIQQIIWYWHHKEQNIIIFRNWIWDIKQKLFTTKKNNDDDFYYNYNWDWYWVTDKQNNPLSKILTNWVPSLDVSNTVEFKEMEKLMNTLYADNSWLYLLFLAFWMAWYLLYWDKTKHFPLIFSRGITWSWKTEYNWILQKIFWINNWWTNFENSTLFSMTVTLAYMIKFPYFISEYREASPQRIQKVWLLKSVFDKIWQWKWRADQSLIMYDYVASPVIDWEEMISDWALRTRSIQLQLLNKHKIQGNFTKILREWQDIIKNILFSYLVKSEWELYQKYLDDWYEIFKEYTSNNRIAENMSNLYAWCMCYSEKYKEEYLFVLSEVLTFQDNDALENSTSMQIIKVMSKFMENSYNSVYVRKNDVVISWNALEEFVNRYRIETTLKISSYREHLITMWFNIEYTEVYEQLVEWVIIPFKIIPKNLLVESRTYQAYKEWLKLNNNK